MEIKIYGDQALFCRPECMAEPYSYPIITPTAAKGVLRSIFWKPEFRYTIDEIVVLNPIRYQTMTRNMIKDKPNLSTVKAWEETQGRYVVEAQRTQQNYTYLTNVAYVVRFELEVTKPGLKVEKYYSQLQRRLKDGAFFKHPCLGIREFPAYWSEVSKSDRPCPELAVGKIPLGRMPLNTVLNQDGTLGYEFFDAVLEQGVLKCSKN